MLARWARSSLKMSRQAHGATYSGRQLGTIGDIAAFSLQFFKLVSTGEGGVVVTSRPELHARAFAMHDAAAVWTAPDLFDATDRLTLGPGNLRMSEIEGALGLSQLKRLDRTITRMREIRTELDRAVADSGVSLRPQADPAGDAGTALVFYCDDVAAAEWAVERSAPRESVRPACLARLVQTVIGQATGRRFWSAAASSRPRRPLSIAIEVCLPPAFLSVSIRATRPRTSRKRI